MYVKFVVDVCKILLIYQSNDILVVSSPLYGSEVFIKLTVKGPHPTLVLSAKTNLWSRIDGYSSCSCICTSIVCCRD